MEASILSFCILTIVVTDAAVIRKEINKDCTLRLTPGPCYAFIPSWAMNSKGICIPFVYGGCGGNANRFGTKEECEMKCGTATEADICSLPLVKGPCEALGFPWGFDNLLNKCRKFEYGGCDGNENRFSSEEECVKTCAPKKEDICRLPLVTGPCEALGFPWGYDTDLGKCRKFQYGGCQGNANRFSSEEECVKNCKSDNGEESA